MTITARTPAKSALMPGDPGLARQLSAAISGEVRFDEYSRTLYSTDASIYRIEPLGVVLPRNADDVSAVMEIAAQNQAIVLPRGGGTGLSGQTVNRGVVVDFSKYMHDLVEVNPEERWAIVQPGITLTELNRRVRKHGLFYAPDPSTASRATIGGGVGNNSCGAHSIVYGKTVDQVLGLDVVLSDGTQTSFGPTDLSSFESLASRDGLEGAIYRGAREIAAASRAEADNRFAKILRRVGGYNVDLVETDSSIDFSKLIVGSEGTLVFVTQAKVQLHPIKKFKGLAVLHFKNLRESMEATVATLDESPSAVEHIGQMIITQAKQSLGFARNIDFLQGEPTDILVVEFDGDLEAEVESKLDALEQRMNRQKLGYAITRLMNPADQAKVWAMREAGLGLMMNVPGDAKPLPFVEDTAVAPEKLPDYVERFDEIVKSAGTEAGYYGHASVGCLHIRPVVNLKNREGIDRLYKIADEISDLVLEFNGSLTGEHGDGIVRGFWADKMYGKELVGHFRDIKRTFDPDGRMNPGKVFDTPHLTDNLRYGANYKTLPIETTLDFTAEGGFAGAIEKCNGVGACRKVHAGAMCPSYQATREEEHSTRGRANALRAAMSGALPTDQLNSKRMFNVLDLCLECKSCKSECPSNVDMAKIKYEFLHSYYKTHRVPLRARMIGNIHRLNSLATGPISFISNFINQSLPARLFTHYVIGIDKRRKFPKVVAKTFESWFKSRSPNTTGTRGKVVLFHDTFMNFNHPQSGVAATALLEALGYEVVLADRKCCGRPMISKGMLDHARANARYNVDSLYRHVEAGAKIVGCESSCIGALKDEYPDLLPGDEKARAVAHASILIEELLTATKSDGEQQIEWSDHAAEVMLQIHCHERALVGTSDAVAALNMPPGYKASLIDAGCCGMAGSFGFEKEHYDVSMKVGEERLFPAIRAASESTQVAVTGVSCRQQVEDGTGRPARYLAEILADALPNRHRNS